jgi:hypothetical protein
MKARNPFKTPAVLLSVATLLGIFASISDPEGEAFAKPKTAPKAGADAGAKANATAAPKGIPAEPIDKTKKFTTRPGGPDCGYHAYGIEAATKCTSALTCCVGTDEYNRPLAECADFKVDALNCGGCGLKCADGRECKDGLCVAPAGSIECNGVVMDGSFNENNCGACGKKCKALCKDSKCVPCDKGESVCETQVGTHVCRDLKTDTGSCGTCFHECPDGWDCRKGRCVP